MAALQNAEAELLYNRQALGYLCAILFHPDSMVALAVRARWARYTPAPGHSVHENIIALLRAVFEARAQLEFAETYIQVFDAQILRVPVTLLARSDAFQLLVKYMAPFFARATVAQVSGARSFADYRFNRELDCIADRGAIAVALVEHILATTPDRMYRATRTAISSSAMSLYYEYHNRSASATPAPGVAFTMRALERIGQLTASHSPVVRSATPDLVQLRMSSSEDEHTPDRAQLPNSITSIFYVSHDRHELPDAEDT